MSPLFGLGYVLLLFSLFSWEAAISHGGLVVRASDLRLRQDGLPNNLTQDFLEVASAISPICNATSACVELVNVSIPRCLMLRGDPGCWCGNHDPIHYCATCITTVFSNLTTPDQMERATAGHNLFHVACNAYITQLNASASAALSSAAMTSTTSSTPASATPTAQSNNGGSSSSSSNTGVIVGAVVGGVIGLAIIIGAIVLLAICMKKQNRDNIGSGSPSLFSAGRGSESTGKNHITPYNPASYNEGHQGGMLSPMGMAEGYTNKPEPMSFSPTQT